MTNKVYVTWDEFHQDVKELCSKIQERGKFNKIIAVSRGGLAPACIASYILDIRNTDVVNILSYDDDQMRDDSKIELTTKIEADSNTLVIDDLSDSGRTFNILKKLYPSAIFAAVYAKEKGKSACDIFARAIPDNWVVFPWD